MKITKEQLTQIINEEVAALKEKQEDYYIAAAENRTGRNS